MSDTKVRRDLLLRALLEVLDDAGEPVPAKDALRQVRERCPYSDYELSTTSRGGVRGDNYLYFRSASIKTIGWIEKPSAGWHLTDTGRTTLHDPTIDSLDRQAGRQYRALRRAAADADAHRDWTVSLVPSRGDELVRALARRILTEGLQAGGSVLAPADPPGPPRPRQPFTSPTTRRWTSEPAHSWPSCTPS